MPRRLRRWLADLWANGFAAKFFTVIAVIAAVTSPIQFAPPDLHVPPRWFPHIVAATTVFALVVAVVWARPCTSMRWTHRHGGTWTIHISRADLFDRGIPIVVTVDRRANISPVDVGPHSLVATLVARWFGGDQAALRRSLGPYETPGSPFPAGHTIPFRAETGSGLLYCLADPSAASTHTDWLDLATGYATLWSTLRARNLDEIAVPVLGSGFARGLLSFDGLMSMLLQSFHAASSEGIVVKTLHICIRDVDFHPRTMTAAARQLELLGYERLS